MTFRIPTLAACAAALLVCTGAAQETTKSTVVDSGARYTFQKPVFLGYGLSTLEELRGAPVLIEYWSPLCPPCVTSGVPISVQLSEKYRGDLHVILSAAKGSEGQALSFAMNNGWMEKPVMWTTEVPVDTGFRTLPWGVLLSPDGKVVLEGNLSEVRAQLDDKLGELVKAADRGPSELPKDLARALVESNEGNFARARELVQKEIEAAAGDALKVSEANRVLRAVEERFAQRLARARWMLENGYPIDAEEALGKLAKGVGAWEEKSAEVAAVAEALQTPEMKVEIEAQKQLAKIEKKLFEDPDVRLVKQLQSIVEKYPRTKCAERAKKLAKIASI